MFGDKFIYNILDSLNWKIIIRKEVLKAVDFSVKRYPITADTFGTVEHRFDCAYFILFRCYAIVVNTVTCTSRFHMYLCT